MNEVHALAWRAQARSLLLALAAFLPIAALAQSPRPSLPWHTSFAPPARQLDRKPPYRRLGIASYGFAPFASTVKESSTSHRTAEHISVKEYRQGLRVLYDVLTGIAAKH